MFRHSFLITYRSFKKYKSSFFINLTGLSTGMACALLIFLWVNDELAFDKFHENDSRLYQVKERYEYADFISVEESTPGLLAESLAAEMQEVEYASTVLTSSDLTLSVEDKNLRATGKWVGKDYFSMFSFPLTEGDKKQVLADKNAIVISEKMAMSLFNTTENVVGKMVKFHHMKHFRVSGIFRDIPSNSSQQFDFAMSFEDFKEGNPWVLEWGNSSPDTYLVLKEGTNIGLFNSKIKDFLKTKVENPNRTLIVSPFSANYLHGKYENGQQAGGRIEYVKLFSVVAVFILLIACINFMNLSTAKASKRLREVGVKKVVGAGRRTLVFQYLGESMFLSFLSLMLSIVLLIIFLPEFNKITGKDLSLAFDSGFILVLMGITLLTGLIAGSYPAFYLSGFKPAIILKGGSFSKIHSFGGELWLRKGLVVFQFTLSVVLIVAVMVVYKQTDYIQTKNIGYSKDNVIYFDSEGKVRDHLETFLSEVKSIPGVSNASSADHGLVGHELSTSDLNWEGKNPADIIEFESIHVNYGMMEMLDIKLAEGRTFSRNFGADSTTIILNEAAVKVMGLTDPVGKTIRLRGEERRVIGVTKNFHFRSFHEQIRPVFFSLNPQKQWHVLVKIEAGKEQEAIAGLQELYSQFNPGFPFDFKFMDEDYQAQYIAEQRVSVLSRYFAGIAILISCLGLYGLVSFSAEQRRKEIGIRKVLGASVANIMALLSKDFLQLVLVSIVVGSTLSWIAMSRWLEGFAYRIELGWWVFGAAGAAALLIALVTVSFQAIKAAMANPVKNLRTE